jgi:hypothetical protein
MKEQTTCRSDCYVCCRCWWGYNLTRYFWILEGPRIAVIVVSDRLPPYTFCTIKWSKRKNGKFATGDKPQFVTSFRCAPGFSPGTLSVTSVTHILRHQMVRLNVKRHVGNSLPSTSDGKIKWSCTSNSPCTFVACVGQIHCSLTRFILSFWRCHNDTVSMETLIQSDSFGERQNAVWVWLAPSLRLVECGSKSAKVTKCMIENLRVIWDIKLTSKCIVENFFMSFAPWIVM